MNQEEFIEGYIKTAKKLFLREIAIRRQTRLHELAITLGIGIDEVVNQWGVDNEVPNLSHQGN